MIVLTNPNDAYMQRSLRGDEPDEVDGTDRLTADLLRHLTRPIDPEFYNVVQYDAWVQVAAAGNILGSDYIRDERFADRSEAYAFAQSLGPGWVVIRDDDPTRMRNGS